VAQALKVGHVDMLTSLQALHFYVSSYIHAIRSTEYRPQTTDHRVLIQTDRTGVYVYTPAVYVYAHVYVCVSVCVYVCTSSVVV
jgi:hypothetical protein